MKHTKTMMRSLFEKQEKEDAIRNLKIDLISRFYPLTKTEIINYKDSLNFDRYYIMANESIQWDINIIEELKDKIDWTAIWKLKKLKIDLAFVKKYEKLIDFESLPLSTSIEWSDELIEQYGERFNWQKYLITKEPLSTIYNLRRFRDKLDWSKVSRGIKLSFKEDVIEEFKDRWDWKKLSANINIPGSFDFIKRHSDRLDSDELSMNKAILPLIYEYPTATLWNWDRVILNRGIIYNQESFDFMFSNFKRNWEEKEHKLPFLKKLALAAFLNKIMLGFSGELSFFLSHQFIPFLNWDIFSKYCRVELSLDFIEANKDKLNFKERELVKHAKKSLTSDFILQNHMLFDKQSYPFYYLSLSINLIHKFIEDINWRLLSSCETLDWNWEFIESHFDDWNFYNLGKNMGIYNKLISENQSRDSLLAILKK